MISISMVFRIGFITGFIPTQVSLIEHVNLHFVKKIKEKNVKSIKTKVKKTDLGVIQ